MPEPGTTGFPWHRVFHPLCGADPLTLARLGARHGPPSPRGMPAFAAACASALARLPFTVAERVADMADPGRALPPVFIVGHPRSGTTHLHNLLAATGAFTTVPPVRAAMPWETRSLARALKPFIDPYLPATRLIDGWHWRPTRRPRTRSAWPIWGRCHTSTRSTSRATWPAATATACCLRPRPRSAPPARCAATSRRWDGGNRGRCCSRTPPTPPRPRCCASFRAAASSTSIATRGRSSPRPAARCARCSTNSRCRSRRRTSTGSCSPPTEVMRALRAQTTELPPDRFAEVAFEDLISAPEDEIAGIWTQLALPEVDGAADRISAYRRTVSGYRPSRPALDGSETGTLARLWGSELARYGCQRTTKRISPSTAAP